MARGTGTVKELADAVHDEVCAAGKTCRPYAKGAGYPHYDFYQMRAENLLKELEPLIGWANVIPVVRAVLGELL
jgi:hypothetical protein